MNNLRENISEGLRSIKANLLRSILTALIVAIGITSLVGILTAIDGIQASINESFSTLGVNSFEIRSKSQSRGRRGGISDKTYPNINFKEARKFKELYNFPSKISISTYVTGIAEIKRLSKKTNPNVRVIGANENFMIIEGLDIKSGRNFSNIEIQYGSNVAIIGPDVVDVLFEDDEDPLNVLLSVLGTKFKIIGVLEEQGSLGGGGGSDRSVFIPIQTATNIGGGRALRFSIDVDITNPMDMEYAMGEATGLMRSIRRDGLGRESSFEIKKNQSLAERMEEITGYLRVGGFGIGFITLLGASIGLMNIMMVSVTERTKEIGIRKALGATPLKIRQQFLIEAIVVCQMGGILGIFLGIAIGNLVSSFISGSFIIPWFWMLMAFAIGMVVGLASGYYPAYKASKMDPIESLRFE